MAVQINLQELSQKINYQLDWVAGQVRKINPILTMIQPPSAEYVNGVPVVVIRDNISSNPHDDNQLVFSNINRRKVEGSRTYYDFAVRYKLTELDSLNMEEEMAHISRNLVNDVNDKFITRYIEDGIVIGNASIPDENKIEYNEVVAGAEDDNRFGLHIEQVQKAVTILQDKDLHPRTSRFVLLVPNTQLGALQKSEPFLYQQTGVPMASTNDQYIYERYGFYTVALPTYYFKNAGLTTQNTDDVGGAGHEGIYAYLFPADIITVVYPFGIQEAMQGMYKVEQKLNQNLELAAVFGIGAMMIHPEYLIRIACRIS